jgi:hypothetical protein
MLPTVVLLCADLVHAWQLPLTHLHGLCFMHNIFQGSHLCFQIQNLHSNNLAVGQAAGTPDSGTADSNKPQSQHMCMLFEVYTTTQLLSRCC